MTILSVDPITTPTTTTAAPGAGPRTPGRRDSESPARGSIAVWKPRARPEESADDHVEPAPTVLIADHHPASRIGIRLSLERAGFVVAAESATGADAAALAGALEPDACLVDVDIPGGGIPAARAIKARAPHTAVVMLSAAANEEDLLAAIAAGALGYLLKTMDPERLPIALRGVLAGEAAIPRRLGRRLLEEIRGRAGSDATPYVGGRQVRLTRRESQVVRLMRDDLTTREIAARLGISEVTVRRHVSAALRKLEAPDRRAALRLLGQSGTTREASVR